MLAVMATARGTARRVTTKYGDRLVLDVLGDDGKEHSIWRPATDSQLPKIANGERVSLGVDSKGKAHLLETLADKVQAPEPSKPETVAPATNNYSLDSATKQAIAEYLKGQKDLLQFCWIQAETIEGPQTEDSIEKLAMALYISAQRKFNLT
jgi:hypothetical protein